VASVDLKTLSVRELLALWAGALRELRERGVLRTFNNPIGDIAEELVALHYGGQRGSFSQKTWDVQVGDERLQVKALRDTGNRTRRSLSPIGRAAAAIMPSFALVCRSRPEWALERVSVRRRAAS